MTGNVIEPRCLNAPFTGPSGCILRNFLDVFGLPKPGITVKANFQRSGAIIIGIKEEYESIKENHRAARAGPEL
jgi:hypothetical protein